MADLDITLKRKVGAAYDVLYPTTTWTQVESKPTTFTPTSHTHGNIQNNGIITAAPVAIENGDTILIANNNNSQLIERGIAFGTGTTTFLRNDGQWVTPAGGGTVTGTGTANLLTYWTGISSIGSLATTTYPTLTELSYVKGVTSALQTQLNGKAATSHGHTTSLFASSPQTVTSGQTKTLTLSGNITVGDWLWIVWGTNTSTYFRSMVRMIQFNGGDSFAVLQQTADNVSSGDAIFKLSCRLGTTSTTGSYTGNQITFLNGMTQSMTGTQTAITFYVQSISRVVL
jgi:hypothetical protein